MDIILIQPLTSGEKQKALMILENGERLHTILLDVEEADLARRLNKAMKTGEYPEVENFRYEINLSIQLKFKTK